VRRNCGMKKMSSRETDSAYPSLWKTLLRPGAQNSYGGVASPGALADPC